MKKPATRRKSGKTAACNCDCRKNFPENGRVAGFAIVLGCRPCSERGFMLIELMISISIALILLSLLMQIYLASQKSSKLEFALTSIQMNASSFTSILSSQIHQAGSIGCARLTTEFPLISHREYQLNAMNKISINQGSELTIRYAEYPNLYLTENTQDGMKIHSNAGIHIHANDVLLISNCKQAEIVIAANVKESRGVQEITLTSALHNQYEKYSELSRLAINRFYISRSHYGRGNSLFMENIKHEKHELIMGINQMRMVFKNSGVAIDFEVSVAPLEKTWHLYSALT